MLFLLSRHLVLRRQNPFRKSFILLPFLAFLTFWVNIFFVFTKGAAKVLSKDVTGWTTTKARVMWWKFLPSDAAEALLLLLLLAGCSSALVPPPPRAVIITLAAGCSDDAAFASFLAFPYLLQAAWIAAAIAGGISFLTITVLAPLLYLRVNKRFDEPAKTLSSAASVTSDGGRSSDDGGAGGAPGDDEKPTTSTGAPPFKGDSAAHTVRFSAALLLPCPAALGAWARAVDTPSLSSAGVASHGAALMQ